MTGSLVQSTQRIPRSNKSHSQDRGRNRQYHIERYDNRATGLTPSTTPALAVS